LERFFCPENKRSPKKEKKSSPDLEHFFGPQTSVLQKEKKRSLSDLERFLVLNMAQDTGLRGEQKPEGGQNISRGGSCPPTFRAYVNLYFYGIYKHAECRFGYRI